MTGGVQVRAEDVALQAAADELAALPLPQNLLQALRAPSSDHPDILAVSRSTRWRFGERSASPSRVNEVGSAVPLQGVFRGDSQQHLLLHSQEVVLPAEPVEFRSFRRGQVDAHRSGSNGRRSAGRLPVAICSASRRPVSGPNVRPHMPWPPAT